MVARTASPRVGCEERGSGFVRDVYSAAPIRAHAYLMPFDVIEPGAWLLTGIEVAHNERGNGHARELLRRVLHDADKESITLYLSIEPDHTLDSLDEDPLRRWYTRHGFVADVSVDSDIAMVRKPKKEGTMHAEPHPLRGKTIQLLVGGEDLHEVVVEDWWSRVSPRDDVEHASMVYVRPAKDGDITPGVGGRLVYDSDLKVSDGS